MPATDQAIEVVGSNARGDYYLSPREHASRLPESAQLLKDLLQRPELQDIVARYEAHSAEAEKAQQRYKRLSGFGIWSIAAAVAVVVWALAFPWTAWTSKIDIWARQVAIVAVYLAMGFGFWSLRQLDRKQPYKLWREARAQAEEMRGKLFRTVMEAVPDAPTHDLQGQIPILPLKVEYIRRYHLDVQDNYFRCRAADFRRAIQAASQRRKWGGWLIFAGVICALVTFAIPFLEPEPFFSPLQGIVAIFEWIDIGYIDVILLMVGLSIVLGYCLALALSQVGQDHRNAFRFDVYARRLEELRKRLHDVRALALDASNAPKVSAFFAEVQALLDTEHRDWVALHEMEAIAAAGEHTQV